MKQVSIIGTVGLPAKYGGFETLVENLISKKKKNDIHYTVFCSGKSYNEKVEEYNGATLKYVNFDANGMQSIVYDIVSLMTAYKKSDTIVILGVSGCAFLPIFRLFSNKKLVINIDGLEHKREKWGKVARKVLKFSEKMAVKYGNAIIADNKAIQDYVSAEYNKPSQLIAYGGDHVLNAKDIDSAQVLNEMGLSADNYSFTVCRIEPENNTHMILEAFANTNEKLVIVGNWNKSKYGQDLLRQYSSYPNIVMSQPIYDINILHALRGNCKRYIHGHSAGGTNPSLVEAMFYGKPMLAYNVSYNRESTENKAIYFSNCHELRECLNISNDQLKQTGNDMREIAFSRYKWETIVDLYESLY